MKFRFKNETCKNNFKKFLEDNDIDFDNGEFDELLSLLEVEWKSLEFSYLLISGFKFNRQIPTFETLDGGLILFGESDYDLNGEFKQFENCHDELLGLFNNKEETIDWLIDKLNKDVVVFEI